MEDEHLRKNMLKDLDTAIKVDALNLRQLRTFTFRLVNTLHWSAYWASVRRPPPP